MAYEQPKQYQESNRVCLRDVLPLKEPLSMQIETASACNFKCNFCIHGNDNLLKEGKYRSGIMKFDLFEKIVSDLKEMSRPLNYVALHARGEPLLNNSLAEMVRLIHKEKVANEVSFNTNGALLTKQTSLDLIDAGLNYIRFSIEGLSNEDYQLVSGSKVAYDSIINNIAYFYQNRHSCHVHVKIIDTGLSEKQKEIFYSTFSSISDSINIENIADTWKDADLNNHQIAKKSRFNLEERTSALVCPRLFFSCQVRFDGMMTVCDSDWNEKHVMGDVNKESILDIWNGRQFRDFRTLHLLGQSQEIPMCKGCEQLYVSQKDYIDEIAKPLLQYYKG